MTESQIIVLAMPVFLLLMAVEFGVGLARGHNTYRLHDTLASLGLGLLSQIANLFTRLFGIGLYTLAFEHLAWRPLPVQAWWVWLLALLLYDLCYYALHRAGHEVAVLWAAHAVHHQSEDYNLSTALRQTGTGWLLAWLFYLPLALLGVPPLVFAVVALVDLLYQFWVHTRQIGRLGWFDRWFCSPSNHRVHHAVNDRYLDKNYGGILMIWDRLFGSFIEEDEAEPIVYGTRTPLRSWNPLRANFAVYGALLHDSWHTRHWRDKLGVWLRPPGWRPEDVAQRWPAPAFELHRPRFDPPLPAGRAVAAVLLFGVLLAGSAWLLWQAGQWPLAWQALAALLLLGGLCALSWLCSGPAAAQAAPRSAEASPR